MRLYELLIKSPETYLSYKKESNDFCINRLKEFNIPDFEIGSKKEKEVLINLEKRTEDHPLLWYANEGYAHGLFVETDEDEKIAYFIKFSKNEDDAVAEHDEFHTENTWKAVKIFFNHLDWMNENGM